MKHLMAVLILLVAAALCPLFGQTVEINLLVSTFDDGETAFRSSEVVIAGVLDSLFEAGFIGTNARPVGGTTESFKSWMPGTLSTEGFVDFVIVIFAQFEKGGKVPACTYRLVRLSDGITVCDGSVAAEIPRTGLQADVNSACMSVGRKLGKECADALAGFLTRWRQHEYFKA
jgi:hypothetical protein